MKKAKESSLKIVFADDEHELEIVDFSIANWIESIMTLTKQSIAQGVPRKLVEYAINDGLGIETRTFEEVLEEVVKEMEELND